MKPFKIVDNDHVISKHSVFIELVNNSLEYIGDTTDFLGIEYRLRRFINLSKKT